MRIEKLHLKKTKNMRDLGGFPVEGGKTIKYGKLIRSGRLYKLPENTVNALREMNIDTVIDLRIEKEIDEHKPTIIEGATYYYLPLVCTATPGITAERSMAKLMHSESKRIKKEYGTAENYMVSLYKLILFDPESQKKLKVIFDLLLKEENCILWHCNSGKDRTGIVSMLIEGVLGVDRELIIDDYMTTKRILHRRRSWQKFGMALVPAFRGFKKLLYALMDTNPRYITEAMTEIDNRYGSITEYVKKALGVTDDEIRILKEKYLE